MPPSDDDLRSLLQCEIGGLPRRIDDALRAGWTLADLAERARDVVLTDVDRCRALADAIAARAADDPVARTRALVTRAHALCAANRFEDGLATLDEAAALAAEHRLPAEEAGALLTRVQPLARLGRLEDAACAAEAAHRAFESAGETQRAARALVNAGVVRRMQDDASAALALFDRARPAFLDDAVALSQVDSNRAEALLDLDDFAGAEAAFTAALASFAATGNEHAAAVVEGNLADLLGRQGRPGAALRHFERARRRLERSAATGDLARIEAEEAETLATLGLRTDARQRWDEAIPVLVRHGLAREAARAHLGHGRVLSALGRQDEALAALAAASDGFEHLGNPIGSALAETTRAEVLAAMGRPEEAERLLGRAAARLADRPARRAVALLAAARVAGAARRDDRAHALLHEAETLARDLGIGPLLAPILHARGTLRLRGGDVPGAVTELRAALDEVERVRSALGGERARASLLGSSLDLYEDTVEAALRMPDGIAVAFDAMERARSRTLLDAITGEGDDTEMADGPATGDDDRRLLAEVAACRADLSALFAKIGLPERSGGAEPGSAPWRDLVRRREDDLARLEARLAATRRFGEAFGAPLDLDAMQAALGPDEALVAYVRAGGRLAALVVRHDAAHAFADLGDAATVAGLAMQFPFQVNRALVRGPERAAGSGPLLDAARNVLGRLHAVLLAPLLDAIDGADRLTIVPWGGLHDVPWGALWDGRQVLLERCAVRVAPSATLAVRLRDQAKPTPGAGGALFVGVSDDAAPGMEEEVRAIASAISGATLLAGRDATIARVSAAARSAPLVHIATHGVFPAENPMSARLRLADGWLSARELLDLRLPGSNVVLSGCDTARSGDVSGSERLGLVRSLLGGGARGVVASLWPVHDAFAISFFTEVYAGYTGLDVPSEGLANRLRRVQIHAAQRGEHPAFWAGFLVVGEVR